jgi:hypothetical protein
VASIKRRRPPERRESANRRANDKMLRSKAKSLVRNFFVPVPSAENFYAVMSGLTQSYLPPAIMSGSGLP